VLTGVAVWAGLPTPGLAGSHRVVLAITITVGIAAADCRAVTRPPLDYSEPPVPTPFGDLPLDLRRHLFRGPLLLAVLLLVVLRIRCRARPRLTAETASAANSRRRSRRARTGR
jgi:hypothetical protein